MYLSADVTVKVQNILIISTFHSLIIFAQISFWVLKGESKTKARIKIG